MSRRYLAALALVALALLSSRPGAAWASAPNMRENPATVKASPSARPSPVGPRFKLTPRAPEATTRHVVEPTFPYKGSTAHALALAAAGQTVPMWQHSEDYPGGNSYTYTMVGASPFIAGAGSTTITAPIIPIKFVRQAAGTTLSDASQVASDCSQTLSPVGLTQISPMFQNQVPDPEGNGTQWVDALQRGNFDQQTQTGGISPSYHVLLSATTPGGITITVPDADTTSSPGTTCGTSSGVSGNWFFTNFPGIVANLVTSGFISTTQFPLFVMYNTVLCDVTKCNSGAALGFHDVAQPASGLQIYGVYDYDLSGTWSSDTATMSHELAEAIDDPLTNNPVPTWGYIGQDPSRCQQNLEPGDPLSAGYPGSPGLATDTYTVGGITYVFSLQDMAYHSWFYREPSPPTSKAVANVYGTGGQYSLLGFFTGSSSTTVCPGQPTGVTATAGNGQAVVSWTAGPGPVDSYIVIPYLGSTPQTPLVYSSTATSQTVMGLTNGASYTFTVLAAHANTSASFCPYNQLQQSAKAGVDCSTESLPSNAVTPNVGVLPGPPTGVGAIGGDTSAAVSWTAPADGGSPITKYTVTPYIGPTAQTATTFNSAAITETVSGLTNGTTYTFKVAAINSVGTGPDSVASNAVTPLAPYVAGVVGTNGGLYTLASGASGFTADGGVLLGAPAVVSIPQTTGPGLPLYLGTGSDHNLYVRNDTHGWQPLTTSPFSCIDNPAGVVIGTTLYVTCKGSNNALWHAEVAAPIGTNLPTVPFNAWQSLGGVLLAGPSVAAVAGIPTYVVVGNGNVVYQRTLTTGYAPISTWRCSSHPALASNGSTSYFACHGLDGMLYYATNTGGGWSAAQSLGGLLIDGPGIAAAASGPIFFAEGGDHALYHRSIAGPWIRDGGQLQFGAAAAARLG